MTIYPSSDPSGCGIRSRIPAAIPLSSSSKSPLITDTMGVELLQEHPLRDRFSHQSLSQVLPVEVTSESVTTSERCEILIYSPM